MLVAFKSVKPGRGGGLNFVTPAVKKESQSVRKKKFCNETGNGKVHFHVYLVLILLIVESDICKLILISAKIVKPDVALCFILALPLFVSLIPAAVIVVNLSTLWFNFFLLFSLWLFYWCGEADGRHAFSTTDICHSISLLKLS